MLDYEAKHAFKYDYIIRVRPDVNVRMLDRSELFRLKSGDLAVRVVGAGEGIDDMYFYAKRDEMLKFMDLYNVDKMQEFKYFTKMFLIGGIHSFLANWIMLNKLKVVPMRLPASLENKYHISFLPNFDDALKEDIKNTTLNKDELKKCLNFFDKIKELIKNNNTEIKNLNYKEITAEFRIKNQLSYKLGQAMIQNSKSVLGYLKMPYILSGIYNQYKKEQFAYNDKINKNPSLALPKLSTYADYKEAIKCKNHLSYKLGEALIKASKNWYKGGFIKFMFEVIKIKNKS